MQSVFFEIGFIVVLATVLAVISRRLKQPLFLAYIIAGICVKFFGSHFIPSADTLSLLSELGIAFLLFLVGLELNPKEIKEIGKPALIIGGGEVLGVTILGFLLGKIFGFSTITCIYLGLGFSFSSTIIVVKLLAEKGDINALYGRLSVGVLLFQDLIAIMALIFLSGAQTGSSFLINLILTIINAGLFLAVVWFLSRDVLSKIFKHFSQDTELLFVGSIAWCLILAGIAKVVGFSLEIGAFLAGLSLASTSFRFQIGARIKALRDFFVLIFFVVLGLEANFTNFFALLIPAIAFLILVLIVKPLLIIALVGSQNYRKRSAFLAGLYLSQVSEFSLVLAALGMRLGQIDGPAGSLVTLVTILSIILSSYLISRDGLLYHKLSHLLSTIEKEKAKVERRTGAKDYADHVILIGCHRMGYDFWQALKKENIPFVVLDFDPKVIKNLENEGVNCVFGDMGDPEILELLNIKKAKMVISTVANLNDNLELLEIVKKNNPDIITVLTASQINEAMKLYQQGANYVILPHLLGGHIVADLLEKHWGNLKEFNETRALHIKELLNRRDFGHET